MHKDWKNAVRLKTTLKAALKAHPLQKLLKLELFQTDINVSRYLLQEYQPKVMMNFGPYLLMLMNLCSKRVEQCHFKDI